MQKFDRYSSLFWILLSVLICYYSYRLGIGTLGNPGSGFIFFYSGIFIGIMSISVFVTSFAKSDESQSGIFANINWMKIILTLSYIFIFAISLERLGFLITTFLLIGLLLRTIESKNIFIVIFVALAASLATYGVFELWLHIRLPKGIFGI